MSLACWMPGTAERGGAPWIIDAGVLYNCQMPRITIDISEETRIALEEASAREGRSISELIEESLASRLQKWASEALEIVREARRRSSLSESEAELLARKETRS